MQSTTQKRGRPRLDDSETKLRTYKIGKRDYEAFSRFCEGRRLTKSEVLRSLIMRYFVAGMVREISLKTLKELKEKKEM